MSFLDREIRLCDEKDAAFESVSTSTNKHELDPKRQNEVRCYGIEYDEIAEDSSRRNEAIPVGNGAPNETLKLEGYTFSWTPESLWKCERQSCNVVLHPQADKEDTKTVLRTLRNVEGSILSRGCAGRKPINFHIGTPQWNPEKKNVAAASDYLEKQVIFFTTNNNCHIFGARLQEAAKVPLTKLVLHEIGHLFEPLLKDNARELTYSFYDGFPSLEKTLKEISPHYLGKNAKAISENVRLLNRAKNEGKKEITVNGKVKDTNTHRRSWGDWVAQELFAEMLRYYYLEPCLTGNLPKQAKSGWKEFDDFSHRLLREAKINLKKDSIDKPLFPQKRKVPQHSLIETVQDFLEP